MRGTFLLILILCSCLVFQQADAVFDPLDKLLYTDIPLLIGQEPANKYGSHDEFKEYLEHDTSNDDIGLSTLQEIIVRSGFKYDDHYVASRDGYVTVCTRLINPLADKKYLKQPPVMLLHGGVVDPTVYVWASSIQHHPERYPRTPEDGPMTSWNRSLAFMLANNGYDVWLIGTRGSDSKNEGHVRYKHPKQFDLSGASVERNNTPLSFEALEANKYWSFKMDDIIEFELPRQIDRVLELTGARKVVLHSYSQSTIITLTMLSENPAYAAKVHGLISMAPIINDFGASRLNKFAFRALCAPLPLDIGILAFSEMFLTKTIRELMLKMSSNTYFRYNLLKPILNIGAGGSAKWLTFLEPAVVGHLMMPVGFGQLKQYCQQAIAGRLQKYDYGPIENQLKYGHLKPPRVNISDLHIDNWLVVSGSRDNFAPPSSVKQILRDVRRPQPYRHVIAKGYNHIDLVASVTMDLMVNEPILEFINHIRLAPLDELKSIQTDEEDSQLNLLVPKLK